MKNLNKYVGVAAFAALTGFAGNALASTAADTQITNIATVNFDNAAGQPQAAVDSLPVSFTVNLVATAPTITGPAEAAPTIDEGTTTDLTYTVTANANGDDTYSLTGNSTESSANITAAGFSFAPASPIILGGSTLVNAVSSGTTITIPYDQDVGGGGDAVVSGLEATDTIVLSAGTANEEVLVIDSIAPPVGNEVVITLTTAITNSHAAASVIGERQTVVMTVTAGNIPGPGGSESHNDVTLTVDNGDGASTTTATGYTVTVTNAATLSVTKYVRNVTTAGNNPGAADTSVDIDGASTDFYLTGVTAEPGAADGSTGGDILEYLIVVSNTGSGSANNVIVTDPVPAFTTIQTGSVRIDTATTGSGDITDAAEDLTVDNGDEAELNGNTLAVYAGDTATADDSTDTGGNLATGQSSYIIFQVQLD